MSGKKTKTTKAPAEDRLQWWRDARFGMFIHWGLYAVPAGTWKGDRIAGIGEWIMFRAKVPLEEYRALADQFNPIKFNAKKIVKAASKAGMKYLVITAKHHDGFAMYASEHPYNIVDATPFDRDPMAELAKACAKAGIKLCFYYSQDQDWQDPDARGNNWDYDDSEKDFAAYLERKVKPQLRELLTNYGPIGLIWFDTPGWITREQSLDLKAFVHELQPDCLVSGRVGHNVGDYGSMGDNQIPAGRVEGDWETPATMNDTWGFKSYDDNWKSTRQLLDLLCELAGKGVNYLLNIGPTAEGCVPEPSLRRLSRIGKWMKTNGEAIYGTRASPFPCEFPWGHVTCRGNRLYLLVRDWPEDRRLGLSGLTNTVKSAKLLAEPDAKIKVKQDHDDETGRHLVRLRLPKKAPDKRMSVVVVKVSGDVCVDDACLQDADGAIRLPAWLGEIHSPKKGKGRRMSIDRAGVTAGWTNRQNWLSWTFRVHRPGVFRVRVWTAASGHPRVWRGGHEVRVGLCGHSVSASLVPDEVLDTPRAQYFPEAATELGRLAIPEAGEIRATLKAVGLDPDHPRGLAATAVELIPEE